MYVELVCWTRLYTKVSITMLYFLTQIPVTINNVYTFIHYHNFDPESFPLLQISCTANWQNIATECFY